MKQKQKEKPGKEANIPTSTQIHKHRDKETDKERYKLDKQKTRKQVRDESEKKVPLKEEDDNLQKNKLIKKNALKRTFANESISVR